jgi:hypothetical protein
MLSGKSIVISFLFCYSDYYKDLLNGMCILTIYHCIIFLIRVIS